MPEDGYRHFRISSDRLEATGVSDTGRQRKANEDSILLHEAGAFVLLADGMGGHERGGEASRTTVEVVSGFLTPESMTEEMQDITDGAGVPAEIASMLSLVDSAVRRANDELFNRNRREGLQRYMAPPWSDWWWCRADTCCGFTWATAASTAGATAGCSG